ncbi:MAG: class I SAM-dependent methyltransferase [Dehalococcoidales bacterium]|jgi:hypothetical protein|nr:class I SAM-dependent methyltransferase [Dehalococcoidales bacterium]MDD3994187.1 class I SAM-dependent methyltransferase [Dehalococcoidales bacterium]NLT27623.1 class I SAM-dependent methyltransferase [Dehalococcoidales bacterium]
MGLGIEEQVNKSGELNLSDGEGQFLFRIAASVPENEVIVEIGAHTGNSTLWLAKAVNEGNKCKFYNMSSRFDVINRVEKEDNIIIEKPVSTKRNKALDSIDFSYSDSEETCRKWKDKIGLLCINILRDYEDIDEMLASWERHLSRNAGVILFNSDTPGAIKIIKDRTGNTGKFIFKDKVGSLTWIRMDKCIHHWLIDSSDFGVCKYCKRTRNFRKMMKDSSSAATRRRTSKVRN